MKFAADNMLGRLARWLRVIGQDVIYGTHLSGAGLIRAARREERLILTRDRTIGKRYPSKVLLLRSDDFREQLKEVVRALGLDPLKEAFTRCIDCNAPLEQMEKELARDKVPPFVFETQERFSFCPACQRVYWPATHHQRMLEELKSLGF